MTNSDIISVIERCSGMAGTIEYERLSKVEFISWFRNNIQYNSKESKSEGESLIAYLEATMKKCVAVLAIDSWHLANGIHCPSVRTSRITTEDEAITWLANECASYGCKDDNGRAITEGYIKEATNEYGASIFFSSPREGFAILRYED